MERKKDTKRHDMKITNLKFRASGPPGPDGGGGGVKPEPKPSLWTDRDVLENLHPDWSRGLYFH